MRKSKTNKILSNRIQRRGNKMAKEDYDKWFEDPDEEELYKLNLHRQTAKAVLVSDESNLGDEFWLPKSQISLKGLGIDDGWDEVEDVIEVKIPEWLAKKNDLL